MVSPSRIARRVIAAAVLAAAASVVAAPAVAAEDVSSGGFWYADSYGLDEPFTEGAKGQGIKVAVIDDLVNPAVPTLEGVDLTVPEPPVQCHLNGEPVGPVSDDVTLAAHGTNAVSLVAGTGAGYAGQLGGAGGLRPRQRSCSSAAGVQEPGSLIGIKCFDAADDVQNVSEVFAAAVDSGADIITFEVPISGGDEVVDAAIAKRSATGDRDRSAAE